MEKREDGKRDLGGEETEVGMQYMREELIF